MVNLLVILFVSFFGKIAFSISAALVTVLQKLGNSLQSLTLPLTTSDLDSVSQLLLGAAIGEAVAGRKAGNKAAVWGAVAGTIPDLDVLARFFTGPIDALAFHRGLTHSVTFAVVMAPILGYVVSRIHRNSPASFRDWTWLMFLGLFTHPLLDCFTTWGTQLFWPFSDYRAAFKSVFVIDPLYTVPLLICMAWLLFLPRHLSSRRKLAYTGLSISTGYLILTLIVKQQVNQVFESSFERQHVQVIRYDSKPTPFNIILWACTAETDEGYYIGYYSFFDPDQRIDFHYFPKNRNLIHPYLRDENMEKLVDITQGWYTAEPADPGIILNDLRFGQTAGWEKGTGKFAFSYHIYPREGGVKIEEVERDFGDARKMLNALWERMLGEK